MKFFERIIICGVLPVFMAFFITACGDPVPIKEMTDAKKAISRAYTVKADTYAKDELNASIAFLLKCHDQVKSDEMDKAKEAAIQARDKAVEAYNKAVPLLAGETIRIAEESMNEAAEVSADRLAKEEFAKATASLAKANENFQNKSYENAYVAALDADEKAKEARDLAIGKKSVLTDAIAEVKYTLNEASRYNAQKHAFEKYSLAQENLKTAEAAATDLKLRQGFTAVEIAKINADEAYQAALEGSAQEKIQEADANLASAEKSEGASIAKDEIAAFRESLHNARSMYG